MSRLIRSYELMLDFFGFQLTDRRSGEVARKPDYKRRYESVLRSHSEVLIYFRIEWDLFKGFLKYRFHNLSKSGHNYLRITRILKCLAEMGLGHYQVLFRIERESFGNQAVLELVL